MLIETQLLCLNSEENELTVKNPNVSVAFEKHNFHFNHYPCYSILTFVYYCSEACMDV